MPESPGARILVVDDEEDIAELLADILAALGLAVEIAGNGEEALAKLDSERFDAVVCDLVMPGVDGPALYRTLSERAPALARRVAFITGDTLSETARSFVATAGRPVIEKPFSPEDVRRTVRTMLTDPSPAG